MYMCKIHRSVSHGYSCRTSTETPVVVVYNMESKLVTFALNWAL